MVDEPEETKPEETKPEEANTLDKINARLAVLETRIETIADEVLADILIGEDILDELEDDKPEPEPDHIEPEPAVMPPQRKRHWG